MTDNEIIQALECCLTDLDCHKCPYEDYDGEEHCDSKLLNDVLDLINRQKAELSRAKDYIELLEIEKQALKEDSDKSKATAMGVIKRQDAEIERLHNENAILTLQKNVYNSEIKAEAVKEFAERLKERPCITKYAIGSKVYDETIYFSIFEKPIDNLVKEMVGDADV